MTDPKPPFGRNAALATPADAKVELVNAYMAARPFAHDDAQAGAAFYDVLVLTASVTPVEMLQDEAQDAAGVYMGLMAARAVFLARREAGLGMYAQAAEGLMPAVYARVLEGEILSGGVPSVPAAPDMGSFLAESGLKPYMDGALEMFGREGIKNILQAGDADGADAERFLTEMFGQAGAGVPPSAPQTHPFCCAAFTSGLAALGQDVPAPVVEAACRTRYDDRLVPFDALIADGDMLGMMADDPAAYLHRVKMHIKLMPAPQPQGPTVLRMTVF